MEIQGGCYDHQSTKQQWDNWSSSSQVRVQTMPQRENRSKNGRFGVIWLKIRWRVYAVQLLQISYRPTYTKQSRVTICKNYMLQVMWCLYCTVNLPLLPSSWFGATAKCSGKSTFLTTHRGTLPSSRVTWQADSDWALGNGAKQLLCWLLTWPQCTKTSGGVGWQPGNRWARVKGHWEANMAK